MNLRSILFLFPLPLLADLVSPDFNAKDLAPSRLKSLSLEELMDIEVRSVLGIPQKALEAPATMVVVTSRQIEERGYEEIGDVLRDLKGIDFVHVNGGLPLPPVPPVVQLQMGLGLLVKAGEAEVTLGAGGGGGHHLLPAVSVANTLSTLGPSINVLVTLGWGLLSTIHSTTMEL